MTAATYLHTVRHLKPCQYYGLFLARFPRPVPLGGLDLRLQAVSGPWRAPIESPTFQTGPASLSFAGGAHQLNGSDSWDDAQTPKLWLYNLHYFDDLNAVGAASRRDWHLEMISRWIAGNPPAKGVGWEPYPTSCRIVNWIKWSLSGATLSPDAVRSLAIQARHLDRNLEWRLMANHLFANLKALTFAGCFFRGAEARHWREKGLALLDEQIEEQILPDGAHCELSPMYHTIILGDVLDLVNLAGAFPDCIPGSTAARWGDAARAMFVWLSRMSHSDGGPSFFSDGGFASYGPMELLNYAERLDLAVELPPPARLVHLASSGYVRLETPRSVVLFDVGEVGPIYQPGHGHADVLSFEMSHRGVRLFVHPGTSTYTEGPQRRWERSTAAHNTVEIDGLDQSEMWGGFRVARRAHPLDVRTEESTGGVAAEGAHDGYRRLSSPVIHRRRLELHEDRLIIHDSLEGHGRHTANLRFHIHPNLTLEHAGEHFLVRSGRDLARIRFDPHFEQTVEAGTYGLRFGVSQPNSGIRACWSGPCPMSFTTHVDLL